MGLIKATRACCSNSEQTYVQPFQTTNTLSKSNLRDELREHRLQWLSRAYAEPSHEGGQPRADADLLGAGVDSGCARSTIHRRNQTGSGAKGIHLHYNRCCKSTKRASGSRFQNKSPALSGGESGCVWNGVPRHARDGLAWSRIDRARSAGTAVHETTGAGLLRDRRGDGYGSELDRVENGTLEAVV